MPKRPVRIANSSGFLGDRASAMREVIEGGDVDVVTGDYLAELTMAILGKQRAKNPKAGFAATFLAHVEPVLKTALERGIKIVVNAGGLDPAALAEAVRGLGQKLGVAPRVAHVTGDDLTPRLGELVAAGHTFESLENGRPLAERLGDVVTANAYLGGWGIARALEAGADIVICPRVADASLVVGAAAWWHGWARDAWDLLAGAMAAGHVIECGTQATGGNYSGFRELAPVTDLLRPGFPIAEIADDGSSVITKHAGTGGAVTVGTVTAQLVYEVSSTRYLNADVTTHLETIRIEQAGPDRVALRGTRGSPPPDTTKVAVTLRGLYRNELTLGFVGLDVDEKIALLERGARAALAKRDVELRFQRIGAVAVDAASQDEATVLLRVVATSRDEAAVSRAFSAALVELGLASYPGLFATAPPAGAVDVGGYIPTLVPQGALEHRVVLPDGATELVAPPPVMVTAASAGGVSEAEGPVSRVAAPSGDRVRVPLGRVVDARSGDKGSDANVGLWVSSDAAYAWLERELTVDRLRELLPEAHDLVVERYRLPNLRALNFMIRGLLAGGAAAGVRLDRQAKALGEHLRARVVEVPVALVPSAFLPPA